MSLENRFWYFRTEYLINVILKPRETRNSISHQQSTSNLLHVIMHYKHGWRFSKSAFARIQFLKYRWPSLSAGFFICDFMYMQNRNGIFSGTNPLIYSNLWSSSMQICYMRVYFWSPYLLHITRSTCIIILLAIYKCKKALHLYLWLKKYFSLFPRSFSTYFLFPCGL